VKRISPFDFNEPIILSFSNFKYRNAVATEVQSGVGVRFVGEHGSIPTYWTTLVFPDFTDMGTYVGVRNLSSGGNSEGESLILQFQVPLVRVGLDLGNGTAATVARVEALTAKGESLGFVEQVGVETTQESMGAFVGLETSSPEGISSLIVDYGAESREEEVYDLWLEYRDHRPFRTVVAQIAQGRDSKRGLDLILQIQNLYGRRNQVTVKFFDSAGQPLELPFEGEWKTSLEFDILQATSVRAETSHSESGVRVGYAILESTLPVAAQAIFRMVDAESKLLSEAGVEARETRVSQAFPVEWRSEERLDTGFAFANPGEREASIWLQLWDSVHPFRPPWMWGWPTLTLAPGEHKAMFLSEICDLPGPGSMVSWCSNGFPSDQDFEGSIQVISDEPIGVTSLRTLRGYLISSLPVGSTQR